MKHAAQRRAMTKWLIVTLLSCRTWSTVRSDPGRTKRGLADFHGWISRAERVGDVGCCDLQASLQSQWKRRRMKEVIRNCEALWMNQADRRRSQGCGLNRHNCWWSGEPREAEEKITDLEAPRLDQTVRDSKDVGKEVGLLKTSLFFCFLCNKKVKTRAPGSFESQEKLQRGWKKRYGIVKLEGWNWPWTKQAERARTSVAEAGPQAVLRAKRSCEEVGRRVKGLCKAFHVCIINIILKYTVLNQKGYT